MASIRKEFIIEAPPEAVWDAARDVGSIHARLVPGFVTACRMDGGDARIVTFANGIEARERIIDVDDAARRVAWSATGGRLTHHSASLQLFEDGARTRAVWIADLLPSELAPAIAQMIDAGAQAMQRAFAKAPAAPG